MKCLEQRSLHCAAYFAYCNIAIMRRNPGPSDFLVPSSTCSNCRWDGGNPCLRNGNCFIKGIGYRTVLINPFGFHSHVMSRRQLECVLGLCNSLQWSIDVQAALYVLYSSVIPMRPPGGMKSLVGNPNQNIGCRLQRTLPPTILPHAIYTRGKQNRMNA